MTMVDPIAPTRSAPLQRRTPRDVLMRVAEAAVTPLMPADVLDLFDPLRKGAELRGRVVRVIAETADAATIEIKPGRDWAGHRPGQYLRVGVDVDGVRQWRAYSLTHGPRRDGLISITVKAVPGGTVSPHLVHRLRPGTMVHLEQAAGDFVLPEGDGRFLFVTAGSGITPVIGMLRNLFPATDSGVVLDGEQTRGRELDIVVVHLAQTRPDTIFARDLQALAEAGAITLVSRYDDQHGVLDVAELSVLVPDIDTRATYACGPGGLLDALQTHHDALGLALFTERFRAVTVEAGEGGTVEFTGSGVVVEADGAQSLLDAGEAAGVLMPSGCRIGICFGCVVPLKDGAVRDLRNGEVTRAVPGETAEGGVPIQTCISAAAGSCSIEL